MTSDRVGRSDALLRLWLFGADRRVRVLVGERFVAGLAIADELSPIG